MSSDHFNPAEAIQNSPWPHKGGLQGASGSHQVQPLLEEEVESLGQQRDSPHDGQAKGGSEGHHEDEDSATSGLPHCSLVFQGEEEVDQTEQDTEEDNDGAH